MVVAYLRTSTLKQDSGLESQERAIMQYCQSQDLELSRVFKDSGVSGAKTNRPELDKLMELVREGKVTKLVVYSFSRLARSTQHLLEALALFEKHNVDFISLSENVDTRSPTGKFLFTVLSALAQVEREVISERVKSGLINAKAKGKKIGRKQIYNHKLILDLYKKKMTHIEIANAVGCSRSTVTKTVNKGGFVTSGQV